MSWTCSCGSENHPEARFCNQCGAPRPTEQAGEEAGSQAPVPPQPEAADPQAPAPPPPEEAVPPEVPAEAGFAQEPAPPGPPGPPPKKKSSAPLIIAIIVVVAVLGVCVIGIIAAIAIPNFLNAAQRAKQKRAMGDMRSIAAACQAYATDYNRFPDTGHAGDSFYSTVDASALGTFLVPTYIQRLPDKDPWMHSYMYGVSEDGSEFILICPGADGTTRLESIPQEHVGTHCFEDDIVWEDDAFVQSPEGQQKSCR